MPLPTPKKNQTEDEFVSSCMGNAVMMKDYTDQKQRLAVCYSQYRRAKKQKAKGNLDVVNFDDNNDTGPCIIIFDENN